MAKKLTWLRDRCLLCRDSCRLPGASSGKGWSQRGVMYLLSRTTIIRCKRSQSMTFSLEVQRVQSISAAIQLGNNVSTFARPRLQPIHRRPIIFILIYRPELPILDVPLGQRRGLLGR